MVLLAWNYPIDTETLIKKDLTKAGIIILVKDQEESEIPGLEAVVRSGLIQHESDESNSE